MIVFQFNFPVEANVFTFDQVCYVFLTSWFLKAPVNGNYPDVLADLFSFHYSDTTKKS